MNNQAVQTGVATFRPRARILKLIGSELISDEVVAITELVKNAHDADASCVTIEFRGVSRDGGEIVIRDDGHGMDLDTLLGCWMQPAGSSKRGKGRRMTAKGRRMLGEKGVGRFAVDKLGRELELITRAPGDTREIRALFDWDVYDNDESSLADIENHYEIRPASVIEHRGTILRIQGLRGKWNERMFRKMCNRLARLQSPFTVADPFTIYIKSDEFPEYAGELRPSFLEKAPYRLDARFDGSETVEIALNDGVSEEYYLERQLACGPLRIRLFAFDLETDALAQLGPKMEARAWLKECAGMSIYRDGFRLWPYGEPHDDWLRLDRRRVNNPVLRLSNNQIVGYVEISSDANQELRDQTNREGLIHNQAYEDLCELIRKVLNVIEQDRYAVRHASDRKRIMGSSMHSRGAGVEEVFNRLVAQAEETSPELAAEIKSAAIRVDEMWKQETSRQRRIHQTYSDLAAVGHMATSAAPLMRLLLARMREGCAHLRSDQVPDEGTMVELERALTEMTLQFGMLAPNLVPTKEKRRTIDIHRELTIARDRLSPILATPRMPEIELEMPLAGILRTEIPAETFQRVINILLANSFDWLYGRPDPVIRISARAEDDTCVVVFSDNGPGISEELQDRIFEPYFSCKEGGQGMGLTIARSLIELAGGDVVALPVGELGGASIRVRFGMKRTTRKGS